MLKRVLVVVSLAACVPTSANALVIGLGDSIASGFCVPIVADRWVQRVGAALGQPVVSYAANGNTVAQTVAIELPKMGFSTAPNVILISDGTNDTFEEHYGSRGEAQQSNQALVQQAISMLTEIHAMQPNAIIGWFLPRDWGYNDPILSASNREQTLAEVGQYDSALAVYMAQFPYMATVLPFPATMWYFGEPLADVDPTTGVSQYYEAPNVCTYAPGSSAVTDQEHPSDAAQAMIANDMMTALTPIVSQSTARFVGRNASAMPKI